MAQQAGLAIPASWRKPNVSLSWNEQAQIAYSSLASLVNSLDAVTGMPLGSRQVDGITSNVYEELVNYDRYTNQTKFKSAVLSGLQAINSKNSQFNNEFMTYTQAFGVTCARGYLTYGDPAFLSLAQGAWEYGRTYTVSQAQLDSRTFPSNLKNFTIQGTCNSTTMAGGVFWSSDLNNADMSMDAMGFAVLLSTLLAEGTSNQTYIDAASLTANFMYNHLYNIQDGTVLDRISANASQNCEIIDVPGAGPGPFSDDIGVFIEGLSNLGYLTHNSSIASLVRNTIVAATKNPLWTNLNGILNNSNELYRALTQVAIRNTTESDLRDYINAYMSVQYNAVLDYATVNGSNTYAGSWTGPPASSFDFDNQTQTTIVLVSMLALQNNLPMTPAPQPPKSTPIGAIVGGVVGGLALIALIFFSVFWWRRSQRHRDTLSARTESTPMIYMGTPQTSNVSVEQSLLPTPFIPDEPSPSSSQPPSSNRKGMNQPPPSTNPTYSYVESYRVPSTASPPASVNTAPSQYSHASNAYPPDQKRPPVASPPASTSTSRTPVHQSDSNPSSQTRENETYIPTEVLVRQLNERLAAPREWDESEAPPGYGIP